MDGTCSVVEMGTMELRLTEPVDAVVLDLNHAGSESALIAAELRRSSVPVVMLILDQNVIGASATADAVRLKAEKTKLLHSTLKALLKAALG